MNKTYIKIYWPEIQDFMEHPNYKESVYSSMEPDSEISIWFVPEWLYDQVMSSK